MDVLALKFLENETIKLRALEPEDVDLLYLWENDMEVWQVSETLMPLSRHLLTQYIANAHLDIYEAKQLRLIVEHKKKAEVLGSVELFDFDPFNERAGVGILIHKDFRRQGYALQSLQILKNYAFGYLQLYQLYCNIRSNNTASLQLFEKANFKLIGRKKDWVKTPDGRLDEYLLQCINSKKN